jgi:hypothetical protein
VVIAAGVMFCATCGSVGMALRERRSDILPSHGGFLFACLVGLVAALGTIYVLVRLLFREESPRDR